MKKILGLDIGTNSIGWAMIESNAYENPEILDGRILDMGSRIIPMDGDALSKFETGVSETRAAARRLARGARRLNQRYKLRRGRLIEALQILGWLPDDFPNERKDSKIFKKLDKHSIQEYLPYSKDLMQEAQQFFEVEGVKNNKGAEYSIPEDWLIYFLKTKALKNKVSLTELARILYHYNQRRGFKSSRKDAKIEEETNEVRYPIHEKWVEIVKIIAIKNNGNGVGKDADFTFYELTCSTPNFEFTVIKKRKSFPDWLNQDKEVEITKKTTKNGEISYTISEVDPSAWENRKRALEMDITNSKLTISEYYLNNLKQNPNYKIKQRIVDRKYYQEELDKIWKKQEEFYKTEFSDNTKISAIARSLYHYNSEKQKELINKGLFYILFNDIIYFQRGLKSQKGTIANCVYEQKAYKNKDGQAINTGVKVCHRSNPVFQEFRIWQTIHNLKVIQKEAEIDGKLHLDLDLSYKFLSNENKVKLFDLFDSSKEISTDSILLSLGFKRDRTERGEKTFSYKLNYPQETIFPGNETKALFNKVFKKCNYLEEGKELLNNPSLFYRLWHIIYSLPEEADIIKALSNKTHFNLPDHVILAFSKLPEFKSAFASLSQRAILNLLPLMRAEKYWSEEQLNNVTKTKDGLNLIPSINHIEKIQLILSCSTGLPESIQKEFEKRDFSVINNLSGLPTFLAAYIAYGRHSEKVNTEKYLNLEDFKINELIPYNSMRNPVVEKVVRETLKIVKDIWANERLGRPDFIHVELGRDLKKTNKEKEEITKSNYKNKIERDRIITLLKELKYPNFNAESMADIDKFKLWKQQGGSEGDEKFDALFKGGRSELISNAEIEKYKLWAEQGYKSPYSGKPIPLAWLFSTEKRVEIDHIIPRSRYYDDSYGNKVLVEAEFNAEKNNRLAIQFIDECQNKVIQLSDGSTRSVLDLDTYQKIVESMFSSKKKIKHLKLYEVPEGFVERQMNDTKYISRTVAQFLRPIALGNETISEDGKKTIDEGVVYTSGAITSDLKSKWGLNVLWKELLRPRFERLEKILGEKLIVEDETKRGIYHFTKEYKRIDHRHHALDALVIACTTRSHIQYLNSLNSFSKDKREIAKYNEWQKWKYLLKKKKQLEGQEVGFTEFSTPWGTDRSFYSDVMEKMKCILVSHKPTAKLISKAKNKYKRWTNEDGTWVLKYTQQVAPKDEDKYWVAARQSLFGQPYGKVLLAEYKKNIELNKAIKTQIEFLTTHKNSWKSENWRIAKTNIRWQLDKIIRENNFDEKIILKQLESRPLKDEKGNKIEKIDLLIFKKYASKRVSLDDTFKLDKINGMPYAHHPKNWLTNMLRQHLEEYKDPKTAFKGEALEELYKKIPANKTISKVTRTESGSKIENNNKLLDGDAGVNQFFVIEITTVVDKKTGELKEVRKYSTPPFLECIERLAKDVPIYDQKEGSKYIVLSPGDLVYTYDNEDELNQINWSNLSQFEIENIYIMKSSTSATCYFLPVEVSNLIEKGEFESLGKSEKTKDGKRAIKSSCIKLKINRLGYITPVYTS